MAMTGVIVDMAKGVKSLTKGKGQFFPPLDNSANNWHCLQRLERLGMTVAQIDYKVIQYIGQIEIL